MEDTVKSLKRKNDDNNFMSYRDGERLGFQLLAVPDNVRPLKNLSNRIINFNSLKNHKGQ